jgi:hypothetical protein
MAGCKEGVWHDPEGCGIEEHLKVAEKQYSTTGSSAVGAANNFETNVARTGVIRNVSHGSVYGKDGILTKNC